MVARRLAVDAAVITAWAHCEDDTPGITGAGPVRLRSAEHGRTGAPGMTQWAARDGRR